MDITTITQLIGSMGFPIAMCLILLWYINKTTENHSKEMNKMIESLNNNTKAIELLTEKVNRLGD